MTWIFDMWRIFGRFYHISKLDFIFMWERDSVESQVIPYNAEFKILWLDKSSGLLVLPKTLTQG